MTSWPTGSSGIPSGWTVQNIGGMPLSADKETLSFSYEGGSEQVSITCSGEWTATAKPTSYFTVTPSSGTGSATLTVTAGENTNLKERNGSLTITCGDETVTISLIQEGSHDIYASPSSLGFEADGGSQNVTLSTNQAWEAEVSEAWIHVSSASGTGNAEITVTADENTSTDAREGVINFIASEKVASVTVTQQGSDHYFSVSEETLSFSSEGGEEKLTVTTDGNWTATAKPTSYFTVTPTEGMGTTTLIVTAKENNGKTTRQGTLTITCRDETVTVSLTQEKKDTHTYVDLGLPSGTLWATCNVGAEEPEEYGDYFAWGETETKNNYFWTTYKWSNGSAQTLKKYNNNSANGTVDKILVLEAADDAATVNWGSHWRTPTLAECDELRNTSYCTWTWTTQNGVAGRLVTSKSNGNSIFLPAAGDRSNTESYWGGERGTYWSATIDVTASYASMGMSFDEKSVSQCSGGRCTGHSIRPVYKP